MFGGQAFMVGGKMACYGCTDSRAEVPIAASTAAEG